MSCTVQQFCTFFIDDLMFGVEVETVQEVIRDLEMTCVPLAPPTVAGLINLRGQIITALDLRSRLGLAERSRHSPPMHVVVLTSDGPASILVDDIGDVVDAKSDDLESVPSTLPPANVELIRGVYKLKDKLLLVLDTESAVDVSAEIH